MTAAAAPGEAAERRLFADTLSCELDLPLAVDPCGGPGRQAQAATLLASLAQLEDLRKEDSEEHGELPLLAQRMDAKLDLILALLGRIANRVEGMPLQRLRWSRHGVRVDLDDTPPPLAEGDGAVIRLQPADWLPDHIELPTVVLAQAALPRGGRLWLEFSGLRPDLSEAIDRHLFRLHRRQIAEQRRR